MTRTTLSLVQGFGMMLLMLTMMLITSSPVYHPGVRCVCPGMQCRVAAADTGICLWRRDSSYKAENVTPAARTLSGQDHRHGSTRWWSSETICWWDGAVCSCWGRWGTSAVIGLSSSSSSPSCVYFTLPLSPSFGHIWDVMLVWRKENIKKTVSVLQYCVLLSMSMSIINLYSASLRKPLMCWIR